MLTVVILATVAAGSGPAVATAAETSDDSEHRARTVARAILLNDQSIQSMHWSQTVVVHTRDTDEHRVEPMHAGEFAFDQHGRWRAFGQKAYRLEDGGVIDHFTAHYAYDGERMFTYSVDNNAGTIRPPEGERDMYLSPELLLGRHIDYGRHRRLGELLLEASDLTCIDAPNTSLLELRCTYSPAEGKWFRVHVTVDPARRFLVTQIDRYDDVFGGLKERIGIEEAELVGGTWIPIRGRRSHYSFLPPTESEEDEFEKELVKAGLEDGDINVNDPKIRDTVRAIYRSVFGDESPRRQILGNGIHELVETEILAINTALPDTLFRIDYPPDATVFDRFRGREVDPEELHVDEDQLEGVRSDAR